MSTFTDDFNRGDGGLGNNWVVVAGSASIASNQVNAGAATHVHQQSINASGRQEAILVFQVDTIQDLGLGAIIKRSSNGQNFYTAYATGTLASPSWLIRKCVSNSFTTLVTIGGSGLSAGEHITRLLYNEGLLTFWVDGAFIGSFADSSHGANTGAGIYTPSASNALDSFTLLGDETVTLSVSPSPIGNFGNSTDITFTGVTTSWTAGTPGTPTFTVDHGTLTNQSIASATSATATYTPGSFLGIATFADPLSGATCQVTVTSDTTVVFPPSGAGGLSETIIDWLQDQAEHVGIILKQEDTVTTGGVELSIESPIFKIKAAAEGTSGPVPNEAAPDGLAPLLWLILNGGFPAATPPESGPYDLPLAHGIDRVHDQLTAISGDGVDTLDSVLQLLGGDPFASNNTIYQAIQALPGFDDSAILASIAALRGDESATVAQALASLAALRTGSNWTLDSVKGWIESITDGDDTITAAAVLAVIAAIALAIPTGGATLAVPVVATGGGALAILSILFEVASLIGTLADVATDVVLIRDALTEQPASGAPVWIDEAHADVGDAVALVDALDVTGPLDGLIVTITDTPSGASKFGFGAMKSWRYVGAVIFQNDRGDWEWSQPIGLESQIITPRTMQHAAAARFRVESGWQGTVRAFTVTAGA